jgi:uncharacterized protein (TIGR03437 family)
MKRITFALAVIALPLTALADISGTATVNAGAAFNFDKGAAGSGDIQFTGNAINFQGGAKGANVTALIPTISGQNGYDSLNKTILGAGLQLASPNPIPASSITAGTGSGSVIGIQTNGGNLAKVLVTAISASAISFQYTTFGATGGSGGGTGGGPTVKDVQNNSSTIPTGFTNSGVTPSSLIVIHGSNMADPNAQAVLQDSSKTLPTTLNGASAKVTAGGKDYPLPLYYAIASQIAAVLPHDVPTGNATVTVTYNNQSSAAFSFTVVSTAFGISNYNGNTAVAQDSVTGALITPTNSAKPGGFVTLWGTGLGADPADSDTTQSSTLNKINVQTDVYFGGVKSTNVSYVGSAFYPGVNIIVAQVPNGVANGCFVSVAVVTGGQVLSNTPTMALMNNGGVCNDPSSGLSGSQLGQLSGLTTVRTGIVSVSQITSPTSGTQAVAFSSFQKFSGSSFVGGSVSAGACTVTESVTGGSTGTTTGLNAGQISVTGPGVSATLQTIPTQVGSYFATIANVPQSGGTFTFTGTGASGTDTVGAFTANVVFPNPLISWTNQSDSATVTRSAGQTYNWSGGAPGTFVTMSGSSSANGVNGSYVCIAPVEAKTFTVPPYILFALPAGSGSSTLQNSTNFTQFTASGIDYGYAIGSVGFTVNSTVK